tara:strand:- start:428 stop:820 length:393 start_codon:yes stop_codon:yes gene_type:complete
MGHVFQLFQQTHRCGGYGSYGGHCGGSDCETCHPGCGSAEVEAVRDLSEADYEFDPEEGVWEKVVSMNTYVARKIGAKHGFKPGTRYRKTTTRVVDDKTGKSRHYHSFRKVVTFPLLSVVEDPTSDALPL